MGARQSKRARVQEEEAAAAAAAAAAQAPAARVSGTPPIQAPDPVNAAATTAGAGLPTLPDEPPEALNDLDAVRFGGWKNAGSGR